MGIRLFTWTVSIVFSIAFAYNRLAPVLFTGSIEPVTMEDVTMGNPVSMEKYEIYDGDLVGHRMVPDLIAEAVSQALRVRVHPHPATNGEFMEITPNQFVSLGRVYYFTTEKGLPGDPAPNRVPYSTALYALKDPMKRTLKTFAEEKRFSETPEGKEKLAKEKELIRTQFIFAAHKALDDYSNAGNRLDIIKANFLTITGHEFSIEKLAEYQAGELEPVTGDGDGSIEPEPVTPEPEPAASKPAKTRSSRGRSKAKA